MGRAISAEETAGTRPQGSPVTVRFDGRLIETSPGLSLAAALTQAGVRAFRSTRSGAPRGIFCGMGVCQDCVVTVDGVPNQRACMTIVRDGMLIDRQNGPPKAAALERRVTAQELAPDLLVIGGGPSGLSAAAVAAEAGLDVLLIDERPKLGGQFFKQPADGLEQDPATLDRQFRQGQAAIARAKAAGVSLLSGVTVWAASAPDEIAAASAETSYTIRPKRLVIAAGAYERGVPVPGWTLPGFMTTGAAQTLLRSYGIAPGRRVLIAGNGPLNIQVAVELLKLGCVVAGLVELAPAPGLSAAGALIRMAIAAPDLMRDGIGYAMALRRRGVPVFHRHAVIRAEGDRRVERAVIAEIDAQGQPLPRSEVSFEVDTVCVGYGFLPNNEIARALGCQHRYDAGRGHFVIERDDSGRSSLDGVWVVGDCGGLGGARMAQAMGVLAGADCARDLGRPLNESLGREAAVANVSLQRAVRFQSALWELYRAPRLIDQLARPDTPICRCEEVSLAAIEDAAASDIAHIGAIKRVTRAGMGRCQGRYCASLTAEIVARRTGLPIDEFSLFAPRTPFKPISIADLALSPSRD